MLLQQAKVLDQADGLAKFQQAFALPKGKVYLCGHSLGPMPIKLFDRLPLELRKWAEQGVEGHFTEPNPWVSVNETCVDSMARLVGARAGEVAVMNSLTVNLHLLLTSFYTPRPGRGKILMERNAFPSDLYCVHSHVQSRGLDPSSTVVLVDNVLDVLRASKSFDNEICLCFVGGVNYQTGEVYAMQEMAKLCAERGVVFGLDLAHAAGNVPIELHEWGVDFAAWCTYKYLNSGPGGIACAFVHDKHASTKMNRLAGWWGNRAQTRFEMKPQLEPEIGAMAWQVSNPPVLQIVSLRTSLDVFDQVPLQDLFAKSKRLTGFLDQALHAELPKGSWQCLTPQHNRGCQLSLVFPSLSARSVFDELSNKGIMCDFREPNIVRVAPNPLYNSFADVAKFVSGLRAILVAAIKL
ncbi:kynureninase [Batrachochytrium salamandrivorans]|nr:kynureninase [Batrachochytrium salamandrivorans]